MKKRYWSITVTLLCVLVGVLCSILLYDSDKISGINNIITPKVIDDYKAEIDNQKRLTNEYKENIIELETKLENYGSDTTNFETVENELYNELQKYDIIMGRIDLSGPGVEIVMSDSIQDLAEIEELNLAQSDLIIHNFDVLEIINELRYAGAEVVAINGHQLTWNSNIDCVGPVIHIDNFIAGSPFRIQAIGDQEQMMATLESLDSYIEWLRFRTINITINKRNNINIYVK